jgi:hypothetical protein
MRMPFRGFPFGHVPKVSARVSGLAMSEERLRLGEIGEDSR